MPSDHELVNFQENYELNYHLRKVNKSESIANRGVLMIMGAELKARLKKRTLTHGEFHPYVNSQKARLS